MLLQIKLPGQQSSSQLIEDIFYRKYPHLRKLRLKSFRPLETFADIIDQDIYRAFDIVVTRKTIFALNWCDFILIHPDCVIDELKFHTRRVSKKLRITENF